MTIFLKAYAGRPRPNFFALCDYKGYLAVSNGANSELYMNLTDIGVFGNVTGCNAAPRLVRKAFESFVSGHTSLSFAGLGTLSFFLYKAIKEEAKSAKSVMCRAWLSFIPLFLATLVGASRTVDYYHNYSDVIGGAMVGILSAAFCFSMNYGKNERDVLQHKADAPETVGNAGYDRMGPLVGNTGYDRMGSL